ARDVRKIASELRLEDQFDASGLRVHSPARRPTGSTGGGGTGGRRRPSSRSGGGHRRSGSRA
ncbi:MAG TPA: hypothetical protein VF533_23265, partial [Solirubrobacteraceae bacterium]